MQYQAYQLEVSDRGRSARASLKSGDLNAALDAVEESIATAEQNLHWADMAPVKQLFLLLRYCTIARGCPISALRGTNVSVS